jgi:hypothetical protein
MQSGFCTENGPQNSHLVDRGGFARRRSSALAPLAIGLWLLLGCQIAFAQARKSLDLPEAPATQERDQQQKPQPGTLGTTIGLVSRRSVFFPELAHQSGSLSSKQKLELAADISIAPSRILSSAATSAVDQARNAIPGYGQGWNAYGKRFGSSMATTASANLFGTFVFASALHQDPRYFVRANGTFTQKVGNAFRRLVVTRTDSGGQAPNWSGLLGDLLAESSANSYLPDEERTTGKTFRRFGIRVALGAGVNVFKEYWPNIFKNLRLTRFAAPNSSGQSD